LVNTSFYLTASSGSLNPANTNSFDLAGPGPTSQIILNIASCQQSIQWQGTCTAGATLEDAYTNVATGDQSPVTFNFTGTGSVSQSGFTQNAGQASETLTGNTLGPVNVTASAEGISSNSASFTVVGKNQAITWTAPGTQTWGSSSVTLGGSGPLGGTSASFPGTGGSSIYTTNPLIYTTNPLNNPTAFSTSLWFKASTPGAIAGGTTEQSSVTVTHWDRNLWIDQAGHLVWAINDNGGALDEVSSPGVYDNGTWHQIVATYGPAGEFLYVDGVLVASNVNATAGQNYPMYWHLGYAQMLGWPDANVSDYFQGSLAQAALYTTQLSQANVTACTGPPRPRRNRPRYRLILPSRTGRSLTPPARPFSLINRAIRTPATWRACSRWVAPLTRAARPSLSPVPRLPSARSTATWSPQLRSELAPSRPRRARGYLREYARYPGQYHHKSDESDVHLEQSGE